jgi:beta-hydroxylase
MVEKTFMTSDDFTFLKEFEGHYETIRQEFLAVQRNLVDWPEENIHNGKWKAFGIVFRNEIMPTAAAVPFTAGLVKKIPRVWIAGFSILLPGCEIFPHEGYTSAVYRAHLGLFCDGKAYLQVGDETYHWKEGEAVVFDDTKTHSAANPSDKARVILLLDFLKPQ